MSEREVIHLSVGSPACAVTAHWCNLQGLAGTAAAPGEEANGVVPPCSAAVTHSVYQQQYRVPRALFMDRPAAFVRQQQRLLQQQDVQVRAASAVWGGAVEPISNVLYATDDFTSPSSLSNTSTLAKHPQHEDEVDPLSSFFQTASTLAYGPYSRYRTTDRHQQHAGSTNASYAVASNGRHVAWDSDQEEDDDDDDDEYERERIAQRLKRQRIDWYDNTYQPLQFQLDDFWTNSNRARTDPDSSSGESNHQIATTVQPAATALHAPTSHAGFANDVPSITPISLPWIDYYMPPYHPKSCLPLPQTAFQDGLFSLQGQESDQVVEERLRSILEDCDACQGVVLMTASSSFSEDNGSVTTALLQNLQDECPAAHRMVVSLYDNSQSNPTTNKTAESSFSWHAFNAIHRVRQPVLQGLALHQYRELAHAVLPLQLPNGSALQSTALAAAALECTTLAYRLNPSSKNNHLVGLQSGHFYGSYSGDLPFGTAPSLTFREFLGQLRPSNQHVVLELDMMMPRRQQAQAQSLENRIQQGTSLERDRRMRQGSLGRMDRDALPGSWMLQARENVDAGHDGCGILTSLSPFGINSNNTNTNDDRSLHHHFALSTALRTATSSKLSTPQYLTCLMESMGPRYRPEQATATVLHQSLEQLTDGGYGAGSYWKTAVWNQSHKASPEGTVSNSNTSSSTPVLAVLGNSTRRYSHLNQIATDMKQALSPKLRGFYNRDVTQGVLPELEDCQEALAACWDLRDTYTPPEGSGIVSGEHEGAAYLDDL